MTSRTTIIYRLHGLTLTMNITVIPAVTTSATRTGLVAVGAVKHKKYGERRIIRMAKKNTVKCKGCGCEVWVGSKIIDGYCHDCYARGRHLPPIVEDPPWSPQKKKPKPRPIPYPKPTAPPTTLRGFWQRLIWGLRRISRAAIILLAIVGVGASLYYGIPALLERWGQTTGESGSMNTIRDIRYSDFINRGERIPEDTLPVNAEAITAFTHSNESYRMSGIFEYAFYDYTDMGREKRARSNIEMSYNSENDVYRFGVNNSGDDADGLAHLRIADGTYYIVRENGTIYVLYHGGGRRTAADINDDRTVYDFLLGYVMENLVQTGFITDSDTTARHYMGGDLYSVSHNDMGDGLKIYGDSQYRTELRTYQHRPISWYDCDRDKETGRERQIMASYYYEDIPTDAPSVVDWGGTLDNGGGTVSEAPNQSAAASSPAPSSHPSSVTEDVYSSANDNVTVTLDKTVYAPNETISVAVENLPQEMNDARAFVAIYDEGAAHAAYGQFKYPTTGGSVLEFTAPDMDGNYEMRLYRQDYVYTDETFVLSVRFSVDTS